MYVCACTCVCVFVYKVQVPILPYVCVFFSLQPKNLIKLVPLSAINFATINNKRQKLQSGAEHLIQLGSPHVKEHPQTPPQLPKPSTIGV